MMSFIMPQKKISWPPSFEAGRLRRFRSYAYDTYYYLSSADDLALEDLVVSEIVPPCPLRGMLTYIRRPHSIPVGMHLYRLDMKGVYALVIQAHKGIRLSDEGEDFSIFDQEFKRDLLANGSYDLESLVVIKESVKQAYAAGKTINVILYDHKKALIRDKEAITGIVRLGE